MKPSLISGSVIVVALLSGCASVTSPSASKDKSADIHKEYWAKYDHSIRPAPSAQPAKPLFAAAPAAGASAAALPSEVPLRSRSCSEPAPDSALKLIESLEKSAGAKTDGSVELDASVVRLAERTQMLGFLRDSLYRICEQSANKQITREEAATAYNKVMDAVFAIVETDRDRAKESAAKALKSLSPEQIKALK
jgi:hypothetical protein